MDKDTEITGEILEEFIEQHEMQKLRYLELYNKYLSRPQILAKPLKGGAWKPDYRLVGNFGKYLDDTCNGFFYCIPMRPSHDNEHVNDIIQDFWKANYMDNTMNELAKS